MCVVNVGVLFFFGFIVGEVLMVVLIVFFVLGVDVF